MYWGHHLATPISYIISNIKPKIIVLISYLSGIDNDNIFYIFWFIVRKCENYHIS